MPNIAHKQPARPSSEKTPPPKSSEAPLSWVHVRRCEGDSPVVVGETIGSEIRRQAAWLALVLQQKTERYGKEIGGSIDIEDIITRLLDVSLEADGIEADFERLYGATNNAPSLREHSKKTGAGKTKGPKSKGPPSSGMKSRAAWTCEINDDEQSIGEAMRKEVSALASWTRQQEREQGLGASDPVLEAALARLMAISLEIEDVEATANAARKADHEARIAAKAATNDAPDPVAPTNPAPLTGDALADSVFDAFKWPGLLTVGQRGLAQATVRQAARDGFTSFHGLHALLFNVVRGLEEAAMLPSEPKDETLGKAMRRLLGDIRNTVARVCWGTEGAKEEILSAADVLMKLSHVADEIDGVDEEEDEEVPPTSAGASSVNDEETAARIAARQAREKADLGEVREEYNEIASELEALDARDSDVALGTLLLGAVGYYPSAPLSSLLEEIKVRTSTLSHLTGYVARGQFSGTDFDKEGSLESIASEMTSLAHKAETAFELMKRLGLGWKVA